MFSTKQLSIFLFAGAAKKHPSIIFCPKLLIVDKLWWFVNKNRQQKRCYCQYLLNVLYCGHMKLIANHNLLNLAKVSPKLLQIITFIFSFWLVLGQFQAYAASITVSPPKFEFEVEKGQTTSQSITITNGEGTPLNLAVSAADFTAVGEEGKPSFSEDTNQVNSAFSLASWISLPNQAVVVPAGGKLVVPFTVKVPEHAEAGGHFGTIFFSPVTAGSGDIAVKQKVGVLLLVRVKGEIRESGSLDVFGTYNAKLTGDEIAGAKAQSIFENFPINIAVRLTNTGNVHTKPQGKIIIKNTFGQVLTRVGEEAILNASGAITGTKVVDYLPVNDRAGNILPNSSRVFLQPWKGYGSQVYDTEGQKSIAWKGLGIGRYTAELDLTYAGEQMPKQTISFWIMPWKVMASGLALIIALYFIIKKWRQMSRERLKRQLRRELEGERN